MKSSASGNQRGFSVYSGIEISLFVLREQRGWDLEVNLSLRHMVFWDIARLIIFCQK